MLWRSAAVLGWSEGLLVLPIKAVNHGARGMRRARSFERGGYWSTRQYLVVHVGTAVDGVEIAEMR
jgi:hypothetical protein